MVEYLAHAGGRELLMAIHGTGVTCLALACLGGHLEVVRRLLDLGGRELMLTGDPCVFAAAHGGHRAVLALLVERGGVEVLLHARPDTGFTGMHLAAAQSPPEVVHILAEAGGPALVHKACLDGRTPLHLACFMGRTDSARMLAELGGEELLAAVAEDGRTCLHDAATGGHEATLAWALRSAPEAVRALQDLKGKTALDVLREEAGADEALVGRMSKLA